MKNVTVVKKIYLYRCIPNQLYTFLKAIVKLGVTRLGVAFHQSNRIKAEYQFSFQTPNYTPEKTTRRMHQHKCWLKSQLSV